MVLLISHRLFSAHRARHRQRTRQRLLRCHPRLLAGPQMCLHHRVGCARPRTCPTTLFCRGCTDSSFALTIGFLEGQLEPSPLRRQLQPEASIHCCHAGARMSSTRCSCSIGVGCHELYVLFFGCCTLRQAFVQSSSFGPHLWRPCQLEDARHTRWAQGVTVDRLETRDGS